MGPQNSIRTRSRTRKIARSSKQPIKKNTERKRRVQSNNNDDDEFPKTEGTVFEAVGETITGSPVKPIGTLPSSSCSDGCSTPKGKKFRIPEVENCPPAPKKRRIDAENWSLRRSPIKFFASPELELFFHFALRGISV